MAELSVSDSGFFMVTVRLTARTVVLSEGPPGEQQGDRSADLFLRSLRSLVLPYKGLTYGYFTLWQPATPTQAFQERAREISRWKQ